MPKLSAGLERALVRAMDAAAERLHEYTTLEHLLFGLTSDPAVQSLFEETGANAAGIKGSVRHFIDNELSSLVMKKGEDIATPTAAFQRVVQRAVLYIEGLHRDVVNSEEVLLSLFAERDSPSVYILHDQGLTRKAVVDHLTARHGPRPTRLDEKEPTDQLEADASLNERAEQAEAQLKEALQRIADLEAKLEAVSSLVATNYDQSPDIFLCYRRTDRKLVEQRVSRLRFDKFSVWWDADIPPTAPWEATIEKQIAKSRIVIVCWSSESVVSDNVKAEARFARDRSKLLQVHLDETPPPMFFGERQGLSFGDWDGSETARCYQDLILAARRLLLELSTERPSPVLDQAKAQHSP